MINQSDLRSAAFEAGLDGFGVCSAKPFPETSTALADAVESGRSAGMAFTFANPERSTDVTSTWPWARSLVVGSLTYLPAAGNPGPPEPGSGRIARFSTEDHYKPLARGLGVVAAYLEDRGHRTEVLVDDNRLVDRAAAVRSGVAWWGKNTMVLAPGAGPWLLVGSVVTDALLEETPPMARGCGSCQACLPACPTGALVEPGVLDARLCLAYWLQSPQWIPRPLRVAVGDRFYGCDDCLEACPPGSRLLQIGPQGPGRVDLVAVLQATDAELLETYARFYIPRRRPSYLRRNALVALGNSGSPQHAEVVGRFIDHPDPMLRAHAAWALGRLGGETALQRLAAAAAVEEDSAVGEEIEAALGSLQGC